MASGGNPNQSNPPKPPQALGMSSSLNAVASATASCLSLTISVGWGQESRWPSLFTFLSEQRALRSPVRWWQRQKERPFSPEQA